MNIFITSLPYIEMHVNINPKNLERVVLENLAISVQFNPVYHYVKRSRD